MFTADNLTSLYLFFSCWYYLAQDLPLPNEIKIIYVLCDVDSLKSAGKRKRKKGWQRLFAQVTFLKI